jgi:hypothetical protein
MIVKTTRFLLSRSASDARDYIESIYNTYSMQKEEENIYTMEVCFSGLGPFAINAIAITIKLTSRGRNSTMLHLTATNKGKGLIQRWGCKSVLCHIVQELSIRTT